MIPTVNSFLFIEENKFTSSNPMLFVCDGKEGFNKYFVKYIQSGNEYDFLVYEILCHKLAKYFDINTPEIALVNIVPNSFNQTQIDKNKLYFKPDVIAFGSKEVSNNIMLSKQESIRDKHSFNSYQSPLDLIKIVLLDLHIDNRDRTEENFNLLITKERPWQIYAIDHFYCFGGSTHLGKFDSKLLVNPDHTILRSNFFRQMMDYIQLSEIQKSVENYFYLCNPNKIIAIVDEVFSYIPSEWAISTGLNKRLKSFLTDPIRLANIKTQVIEYVEKIKAFQQ